MPIFQKLLILLSVVVLCGCGDSGPELGEVEGVVTLDGKPLPNAVVTFAPVGEGPTSVGKTGADGHYQLMAADRVGAVLGEHKVSIIDVPEPPPVDPKAGHDDGSGIDMGSANYKPPKPKVPPKYNAQSELTEQVKPGSNTINFDLKS